MKLRFLGTEPTLVQISKTQPKIEVKPKQIFDCDDNCAKSLLNYLGYFEKVETKEDVANAKAAENRVKKQVEDHKKAVKEYEEETQALRDELVEEYGKDAGQIEKLDSIEVRTLYKNVKARESLGFGDTLSDKGLKEVIKAIQETETVEALAQYNYENEDLKKAIDKRRTELEGVEQEDKKPVEGDEFDHEITEQDLKDNPELEKEGLKVGDIIQIPKKTKPKTFFKNLLKK